MQRLRAFSTRSGNRLNVDTTKDYDAVTSSPESPTPLTKEAQGELSPELAPIVTLLSAQMNRKYFEGFFMLLRDLTAEGKPAERRWEEVYGILIGNELSYWNADELKSGDIDAENKPSYINFTDATLKAEATLPSGQGVLNNVIIASTTLKNRFILQYSSSEQFYRWRSAFRLAEFEYRALQEAYTAALLSARGALLSDIRVILTETKFDREDWVSVRFGAGMPWKRCFCVIKQSKKKKRKKRDGIFGDGTLGEVMFFETEKHSKKALPIATIKEADSIYAVYPRNYMVIDHSTMVKLDGQIVFDRKEGPRQCSIFMMPEQHSAVPGYDTMIRFIIPLLDSFRLYGRPKRLNADKTDPDSLLFALPVLPNVHYLEVQDLMQLCSSSTSLTWTLPQWDEAVKRILRVKLGQGYTGCGSVDGVDGAIRFLDASKDMANGKIRTISSSVAASRPKVLGSKFSIASSSPSSLATESIISEKTENGISQISGSQSSKQKGGNPMYAEQEFTPVSCDPMRSNYSNGSQTSHQMSNKNMDNQMNYGRMRNGQMSRKDSHTMKMPKESSQSPPDLDLYPGGDDEDEQVEPDEIITEKKPMLKKSARRHKETDDDYFNGEREPAEQEEACYHPQHRHHQHSPEGQNTSHGQLEPSPEFQHSSKLEPSPGRSHSPDHHFSPLGASPSPDRARDSAGKIVSIYKRYAQFPPLGENSSNDTQAISDDDIRDDQEEGDELYHGTGDKSDAPTPPIHGGSLQDRAHRRGRSSPQKSDLSFNESSGLSSPERDEPDFQLPVLKKPENTDKAASPFSEFHETFRRSMSMNLNYAGLYAEKEKSTKLGEKRKPKPKPKPKASSVERKRDKRITEERRKEREREVRIEMERRRREEHTGEKKLHERRTDKKQAADSQLQTERSANEGAQLSSRKSQRLSLLRKPPPGAFSLDQVSNRSQESLDANQTNAENERALAQLSLGGHQKSQRTHRSPDITRRMDRLVSSSSKQPDSSQNVGSLPDKHSSSRYPSTVPQQAANEYHTQHQYQQQNQYPSPYSASNRQDPRNVARSGNQAPSGNSRKPPQQNPNTAIQTPGSNVQPTANNLYNPQRYQGNPQMQRQPQQMPQPMQRPPQQMHQQMQQQRQPQQAFQHQQYQHQPQQRQHQMPAQAEYAQARYQQQTYQYEGYQQGNQPGWNGVHGQGQGQIRAQYAGNPALQATQGQPYSSPDYGMAQQGRRDHHMGNQQYGSPYIREN